MLDFIFKAAVVLVAVLIFFFVVGRGGDLSKTAEDMGLVQYPPRYQQEAQQPLPRSNAQRPAHQQQGGAVFRPYQAPVPTRRGCPPGIAPGSQYDCYGNKVCVC